MFILATMVGESLENMVKIGLTLSAGVLSTCTLVGSLVYFSKRKYDLIQLTRMYDRGELDRRPHYFNVGSFSEEKNN